MSAENITLSGHGGGFKLGPLRGHDNWMPWKRRMLAIFREMDLDNMLKESAVRPTIENIKKATDEEIIALEKWDTRDEQVRTRIELAVSDAVMIHLIGAETARDMWRQLQTIYESKGRLGIVAARRALFRITATEDFDMRAHIGKLRTTQEQLHAMGSKVPDDDFVMVLITSLPKSWDMYTSAYLGATSNKPTITSHELIAILVDEEDRRRGRQEENSDVGTSFQTTRGRDKRKEECRNCHKRGHYARDCWAPGGGKEGCRPNAIHTSTAERATAEQSHYSYITNPINNDISHANWIIDSATTSHICPTRDSFIQYQPIDATINGISDMPVRVIGKGTIKLTFDIDGRIINHTLNDVLHAPNATKSLISVTRYSAAGGTAEFSRRECLLRNEKGTIIGKGIMRGGLYHLKATTHQINQDRTKIETINQSRNVTNNRAYVTLPTQQLHNERPHSTHIANVQSTTHTVNSGLRAEGESKPASLQPASQSDLHTPITPLHDDGKRLSSTSSLLHERNFTNYTQQTHTAATTTMMQETVTPSHSATIRRPRRRFNEGRRQYETRAAQRAQSTNGHAHTQQPYCYDNSRTTPSTRDTTTTTTTTGHENDAASSFTKRRNLVSHNRLTTNSWRNSGHRGSVGVMSGMV